MKILILGAGVIGCTYGWQLSKVGCDVSFLIRQGKKRILDEEGFKIHCTDYRGQRRHIDEFVFRPNIIEELSPNHDYEYIIVTTNNLYIKDVLSILSQSSGIAHILFMQNIWDDFDEIEKYLLPEQYFFGFPFMAGGGRNKNEINSAISGLKYTHTPIGELKGEITPRLQKIQHVLEQANLKPQLYSNIKEWLIVHYAVAAGLSGGILNAGGGKEFVSSTSTMKIAIKAIREGLKICTKKGVDLRKEKTNRLYTLPTFIGTRIMKKIYSDEALQLMFDGHTKHASVEMVKMLDDLIQDGKMYNIGTPYLNSLRESISIA